MVSSIGSAGAGYNSTSAVQARSQAVDQLFKKTDANRDGKITKTELTQALEADSVDIGSSNRETNVDEIFKLLDTGNKGYITRQDAADALEKMESTAAGDAAATGGASDGASRPARRGGGGGGGGGGAAPAASASTDPADTNGDGTVSLQERIAYTLKQYAQGDSAERPQSVTYA